MTSKSSRRAVLAVAAAIVPVAALASLAAHASAPVPSLGACEPIAAPDPIFAAIENHRAVDTEWTRRIRELDALTESFFRKAKKIAKAGMDARKKYARENPHFDPRESYKVGFDRLRSAALQRLEANSAEYQAAEEAVVQSIDAENAAATDLVLTRPTTRAGIIALVAYVTAEKFRTVLEGQSETGRPIYEVVLSNFAEMLLQGTAPATAES